MVAVIRYEGRRFCDPAEQRCQVSQPDDVPQHCEVVVPGTQPAQRWNGVTGTFRVEGQLHADFTRVGVRGT